MSYFMIIIIIMTNNNIVRLKKILHFDNIRRKNKNKMYDNI